MKQSNIVGKTTLERINPACFIGDVMRSLSFSPNLKKFIRKHPHFTHVYFDPKEKIWYIGYKDGKIWAGTQFLAECLIEALKKKKKKCEAREF